MLVIFPREDMEIGVPRRRVVHSGERERREGEWRRERESEKKREREEEGRREKQRDGE